MTDIPAAEIVLDSWPVIEWLRGNARVMQQMEILNARARQKLLRFSISRINFGEIVYIGRKDIRLSPRELDHELAVFRSLGIEIVSVPDERVDAAVELKSKYNIAYADAFAAALAIERNAPLATGDVELRALEAAGLLQLHWISR